MTDIYDKASDVEEIQRQDALDRIKVRNQWRTPRLYCEDCDDELDPHRRQYGTCIDCQELRERRS